jgi:hypothetical protein
MVQNHHYLCFPKGTIGNALFMIFFSFYFFLFFFFCGEGGEVGILGKSYDEVIDMRMC